MKMHNLFSMNQLGFPFELLIFNRLSIFESMTINELEYRIQCMDAVDINQTLIKMIDKGFISEDKGRYRLQGEWLAE